jgi:hypothetical protein
MVDAAVAILSNILIAGALSSWPTFTRAAVLGFDDWKVECPGKPGDTKKETSARAGRCLAAQRLEEEKTGAVVFAFSVVVDDPFAPLPDDRPEPSTLEGNSCRPPRGSACLQSIRRPHGLGDHRRRAGRVVVVLLQEDLRPVRRLGRRPSQPVGSS